MTFGIGMNPSLTTLLAVTVPKAIAVTLPLGATVEHWKPNQRTNCLFFIQLQRVFPRLIR